jgi:hypothetical protein
MITTKIYSEEKKDVINPIFKESLSGASENDINALSNQPATVLDENKTNFVLFLPSPLGSLS